MELLLQECSAVIAFAAELCGVLCIACGTVEAAVRTVFSVVSGKASLRSTRRSVFSRFAAWIILALEFALAADIVHTAVAPSWNDIGMLAAIATIRTVLNYFLERDMHAFGPIEHEKQSARTL